MTTRKPRNAEGVDFSGSPLDLLERGVFPDWWCFVPVAGKATYVESWATKPLPREKVIELYKSNPAYKGLGVVTGEFSGGLIAIDVDGPEADKRLKEAAGDEYEPFGEESTMAWTSGREGRRQILYRVPAPLVPELRDVRTVILQESGDWHLGQGDKNRARGKETDAEGGTPQEPYQELVLRFNRCQSVTAGSPHPVTNKKYTWLNYNHKEVALAPTWVMDVLRPFRKPVQWLSDADQKALDGQVGETVVPSRQIRGWFFKDEVQSLLMPRLEELVFKHEKFDRAGWQTRGGQNPQRMSDCPWHNSHSKTAFQYSMQSGCWDCKACGFGGDVLDFIHKIRTGDKNASRPQGPDLEAYVAEIATALGFDYPACAQRVEATITNVPQLVLSSREFHEKLIEIHDSVRNPAEMLDKMAKLAADSGRRMTGAQCLEAMDSYRYYEENKARNDKPWWDGIGRMEYTIPDLLQRPSQVLLHAAGGLGKTGAAMGLARAVGRGETLKIRGMELRVDQGPVLWIQNDQTKQKLLHDCEDNGIDVENDKWFVVKRGFQIDHYQEFRDWVREIKPKLVVVDSVTSCSTKMALDERSKAFAHPFYWYGEMNGDLEMGFPATTILWIHHDNSQGEARGSRLVVAAMDEQWHLRKPSDEERAILSNKGKTPSSCRMIQIKKSRLGREGDVLVIERDSDFKFAAEDYTPTERRVDDGAGDPDPHTSVLRIVRDFVKNRLEAGESARRGITAKEAWEQLSHEMAGQGRSPSSQRSVKRWLNRWVEKKMLVMGQSVAADSADGKGKPAPTYTLSVAAQKALREELEPEVPDMFKGPQAAAQEEQETALGVDTPQATQDGQEEPPMDLDSFLSSG